MYITDKRTYTWEELVDVWCSYTSNIVKEETGNSRIAPVFKLCRQKNREVLQPFIDIVEPYLFGRKMATKNGEKPKPLSPMNITVTKMFLGIDSEWLSPKEIASDLGVTYACVRDHIRKTFTKIYWDFGRLSNGQFNKIRLPIRLQENAGRYKEINAMPKEERIAFYRKEMMEKEEKRLEKRKQKEESKHV